MVKIYQPWPAPVQAACFRDAATLVEIERWVSILREQGLVSTDVCFSIRRRAGVLFGVLHDQSGDHELTESGFLVFGSGGLEVLDELSFFRRYRA